MIEEVTWTISHGYYDSSAKKTPYIGTYKVFAKSANEDEVEKAFNDMRVLLIKANLMESK